MIIISIHSRPSLLKKCSKVAPTSRMDSTSRQGQMTASHSPTLSYLSSGTEVGFTNVVRYRYDFNLELGSFLILSQKGTIGQDSWWSQIRRHFRAWRKHTGKRGYCHNASRPRPHQRWSNLTPRVFLVRDCTSHLTLIVCNKSCLLLLTSFTMTVSFMSLWY